MDGERPEAISAFKREIKKYCILALITVRGTGGGVERRALWDVCGKPMIQWVLEAIKNSEYVDRVVVLTEDKEIGGLSESLGALFIARPLETTLDFPRDYTQGKFKRIKPRSLTHQGYPSGDPFEDAQDYAYDYLSEMKGYVPDLVLLADPDYPMVTTKTVDRVIEAFFKDEEATDSGAYYLTDPKYYIFNPTINRLFPLFHDCIQSLDRQDYPPIYRKGSLTLRGLPLKSTSLGRRYAWVVTSPEEGLNVHDKEGLFLAECYMKRRIGKQDNVRSGD